MNDMTTTDFSKFGARETKIAETLLKAWSAQDLPGDFYADAVTIMLNTHSGCVFLTNSDFQVAMMNCDRLESFYSCPICGHEGFKEEMPHNEFNEECQEYLREISAK